MVFRANSSELVAHCQHPYLDRSATPISGGAFENLATGDMVGFQVDSWSEWAE